MIELYEPANEVELMILRSLLDGAGVRYYVRGEDFDTFIHDIITPLNRKRVFVHRHDLSKAQRILQSLLEKQKETED